MSGDHGPAVIVPAALHVLSTNDDIRLILVGDQNILNEMVGKQPDHIKQRLSIHHTTQVVAMDELPSSA